MTSMDDMKKQFTIGDFPVWYMYAHKLFGISNNVLTGIKGTPNSRASVHTSRPSHAGLTFQGCEFPKSEHVAMWLNDQKICYNIQPDRDEVFLPWSFKGRFIIKQYGISGACILPENDQDSFDPCSRAYSLLVWNEDALDLEMYAFHRFIICDMCANLNAKLVHRSITGPT